MKQFTPEELKQHLDEGNKPVILDVRETWEYEICHIDNSLHISMSQIPSRMDELDPDDEIIVMCHHGGRSMQVGNYLESQGFNNIINLAGGIDAWAKSIDTSMKQY